MSILKLPEAPWGTKRPSPVLHPPPAPPDPRHLARMAAGEVLSAEVIAQLDPALRDAAASAYQTNNAASAALNAAQAELASLRADDDDDLDDDALSAREVRRITLERQMGILARRLTRAQEQAEAALSAVRFELRALAEKKVFAAERERLRALREQVDAIEQQIGDSELAIEQARSILGAWLPKAGE